MQKNILIIDDSLDIIDLIQTILTINFYVVITASSGQEALSVLHRHQKIDLVLLDYQMQDMSGPEFISEMSIHFPKLFCETPIVYLSAMNQVCLNGPIGFIRKPILDISDFLKLIRFYIDRGKDPINLGK